MNVKNYIFLKILFVWLVSAFFSASTFGQKSEIIPLPNSKLAKKEIRFAAIGDTGTGGKNQMKLARQMFRLQQKTNFSLLLFLGDNIYENGSPKGIEKKFLKPYAGLYQRGVEFRGVIGNHDARSKYGVILQQLIFNMGSKTYYSFTKGNDLVEFFAIDSTILVKEKKTADTKPQLEWLENRLAKSKSHWKIAFMHHAVYSSAKRHGFEASDEKEMLRLRNALEPLYKKYGVRISLNGHDHVYERTKPQNGVQYFTSGAGAKLRRGNLQTDSPYYSFGNDRTRSFMLFSVKPNSITFWSISIDGNILDSGIIK